MRRWLGPLLAATLVAALAYQLTLVAAPRVLMAAAWQRLAQGGANRFTFGPLATDKSRAIVRPSPDLAYSSCPFDLAAGPLLIDVPAVPAVYWSLSVFDAETNVAFVQNNIDSKGAPIRAAVTLPGGFVPETHVRVTVAQPRGIALVRILVDDRSNFPSIDRARRAATCRIGEDHSTTAG